AGVFKETVGGAKPRTDALLREIRRGVPGTSMQPFDLIPDEELRSVTAYVVHLSLRGEVEFRVLKSLLGDGGDPDAVDVMTECRVALEKCFDQWQVAQVPSEVPQPVILVISEGTVLPDAIRRGQRTYAGHGCAGCHQDYGRTPTYRFDTWGGVV